MGEKRTEKLGVYKEMKLVSVIVTTKNEEKNIESCLERIQKQSYKNIEIIVVDNKSTDKTKEIAKKYTRHVFDKGPERSVQRNFGVKKAKGEYVLILDADMILTEKVVEECVKEIEKSKVGGVIIPEESFGEGFWAQCKKLERSFYIGNDSIEAARFFPKKTFMSVGGFDEKITGPEDWDHSQRVKDKHGVGRIESMILHNEGKLSLWRTLKKKYYYSQKFREYLEKEENKSYSAKQFSVVDRYMIFFSQPKKLLANPVLSIGMVFMKTAEFGVGGAGFILSRFRGNS